MGRRGPYLYGDGSAFPAPANFIDTLRDLVAVCVDVLKADEALEAGEKRLLKVRWESERALADLGAIARGVERGVEPFVQTAARVAAGTAGRIVELAGSLVQEVRREVEARRDAAVREIEDAMARARDNAAAVVGRFIANHDVEGAAWEVSWKAGLGGQPASAQARCVVPGGLEVRFDLDVSEAAPWNRPVHVSSLHGPLPIAVPQTSGLFRRCVRLRRRDLGDHFVTEARTGPTEAVVVLRRRHKRASPGFEFVVRSDGQSDPSVCALPEAEDGDAGECYAVEGEDVDVVRRLWARVRQGLTEARQPGRCRPSWVGFDGRVVAEQGHVVELAERLVALAAPVVDELRRRSGPYGELVLKRDLGDGRREEYYVSRAELERKISELGASRRACFRPLGLWDAAPAAEAPVEAADEPTAISDVMFLPQEGPPADGEGSS